MRLLQLLLFPFVCLATAALAEQGPKADVAPSIPHTIAELRLTNGTVFRNVTIVKYNAERVVLQSHAGLGPIAYSYIPEPLRSQMLRARDAAAEAARQAPKVAASETELFTGTIFIVTRGRDNVKLGDTEVIAYGWAEAAGALDFQRPILPQPLATTRTNVNGEFTLQLKKRDLPAMVRVLTSRHVGSGREQYEWRVSTDTADEQHRLALSNSNLYETP